jgi:hypothetical protein
MEFNVSASAVRDEQQSTKRQDDGGGGEAKFQHAGA